MNIIVFKALICHIKDKYKCVKCKKRLADKDLSIAGITDKQVTIVCFCPRCNTNSQFEVQLLDGTTRKHQNLNAQKVSANDILDVKNFLKSFNGSFKDLFQK